MIQDLRKLREGARLSQKQVADILGIDQSQVSRYESDPSSLPFELGLRWHQALGQRVEVGFETPVKIPGMDAGAPYNELRRRLGILAEYCDIPRLASKSVVPGQNSSGIEQLSGLIQSLRRKPNLGLVGKFDAGKSRIANSLIGDDSLPTGYQPATRLVTIVRHLDDRPSWMREDVWIMSSGFDVNRADDEVHCKRYRVVAGNIRTLAEYGTYGGKHENTDAAFAMVYLPAPILKSCNIIDLPGFRNDPEHADQDGQRAFDAFALADIVVYASAFNGFLDGNDLSNLSQLLRYQGALEQQNKDFPNLGHLYIVATHAHEKVKNTDINPALNKAAKRLFDQVELTSLRDRRVQTGRPYTEEDLRGRMFAFWAESPLRCQHFRDDLLVCLQEHLPTAFQNFAHRSIEDFRLEVSVRLASRIETWTKDLSDITSLQERYSVLLAEAPARRRKATERRVQVQAAIESEASKSAVAWTVQYDNLVTIEHLEKLIRKRFSSDGKNEAKKYGPSYVLEVLQGTLSDVIRVHSERLNSEVDLYLSEYTDSHGNMPGSNVPFDARGAFLGGLAGAGVVGALAVWAASLGNLGAYILAVKAVSVLSAIGFSFAGGTAAVMSVIAAIGGPITLAVGAFVLVGVLAWALFGESWESRLAKKLEKDFRSQNLKERLDKSLAQYWADTRTSFLSAASALESRYEEELQKIKAVVEEPQNSKLAIERALQDARGLLGFFDNMPWKPV